MKVGLRPGTRGFTLVEVMIVLAVTGGLFVAIAVTLSGRQADAQFIQATQTLQSEVEQVINQAASGNYPIKSFFSCSPSSNGPIFAAAAADTQGTNSDCVLYGRAIEFDVNAQNAADDTYDVFTVAGCLKVCTSVAGSSPFAPYGPAVVGTSGSYDNYAVSGTLKYGMQTAWVRSGGSDIGAVAFLMEPGTLSFASTNGFVSGGQSVDVIPLPGTGINQTLDVAATNINNSLKGATLATGGSVQACFVSTASPQSALMNIGMNSGQLTVTMSIRSNTTCS